MGMVKVPKGKKFIKKNERMNQLYLVVQGKVQQICREEFLSDRKRESGGTCRM